MTLSLTRSARFGRALPRDFLDVDTAVMSGRYTRERMLELAAEADHGFDRLLFADALGALTQITDAAFAEYRTDPATIISDNNSRRKSEATAVERCGRRDGLGLPTGARRNPSDSLVDSIHSLDGPHR